MSNLKNNKYAYILLLFWIILGASLRLTNLGLKSPSSIEISSIGFSLGNGFEQVLLDQLISLDTLLSPLQISHLITIKDVVGNLITETNHPPLFFLITHFWIKLFSPATELDLLWLVRLESTIFGIVSIPAIFFLAWISFRSLIVAQISAALMALSPYGIYLAQEARHYTLTILWIIASLGFLVTALQEIQSGKKLSLCLGYLWVIVNILGILTHDLFYLVLIVEAIIVGIFRLRVSREFSQSWLRIYWVMLLTFICCLLALINLKSEGNQELTEWIDTNYGLGKIWQPIPRLIAWIITMIFLLPVEGISLPLTILSGVFIVLALVWLTPPITKKILEFKREKISWIFNIFVIFFISNLTIFLAIIYIGGKDLSQAARYQFVYFPCVIILVSFALGQCWSESKPSSLLKAQGKKVLVGTLILSFLGSLTVVNNYGYQKSQRADILAQHIVTTSTAPRIIASAYYTHAELRSLISLGLELKSLQNPDSLAQKFILIPRNEKTSDDNLSNLENVLKSEPKPLELWTVNLKLNEEALQQISCFRKKNQPDINGYRYRLYQCQ